MPQRHISKPLSLATQYWHEKCYDVRATLLSPQNRLQTLRMMTDIRRTWGFC